MSRTIVFVNNKGGVTKTISSVNTAFRLADLGYKTLLIDIDQQANATTYLGCSGEGVPNIADVFFKRTKYNEAAMATPYKNLFLIPSGTAFINGEQKLIGDAVNGSLELRLKIAMRGHDYDYVIVDCPPSLSTLITNAFNIATDIIIPCAVDGFSMEGLKIIIDKINIDREDYAHQVERFAVLWTRVDKRQTLTRKLIEAGEEKLSCFDTVIRESVKVRESTVFNIPLMAYDPSCNPAIDYRNLVDEIIGWAN